MEVLGSGLQHGGIAVEQRQPRRRKQGGGKADGFTQAGGDGGAGPGGPQRTLAMAGTDIGANDGDERPAQAEHEGNQQIFEARCCAIAGNRGGAEAADQAGCDRDGQVGLHRDDRRDRADLQDVVEQCPAQAAALDADPHDAAAAPDVASQNQAAGEIERQHGDGPTGHAQCRERPPPEDQARRQWDERHHAGAGDGG